MAKFSTSNTRDTYGDILSSFIFPTTRPPVRETPRRLKMSLSKCQVWQDE